MRGKTKKGKTADACSLPLVPPWAPARPHTRPDDQPGLPGPRNKEAKKRDNKGCARRLSALDRASLEYKTTHPRTLKAKCVCRGWFCPSSFWLASRGRETSWYRPSTARWRATWTGARASSRAFLLLLRRSVRCAGAARSRRRRGAARARPRALRPTVCSGTMSRRWRSSLPRTAST